MAWIYLFGASLMEICWMYSLKFISKERLSQIRFVELFDHIEHWWAILPVVGYIVFGIVNILLFSAAMKQIPTATAFAVWTGTALVGAKLLDTYYFGESINMQQIVCTILILIGIVGLKSSS